jgi:alpha-ribazole phosphatase
MIRHPRPAADPGVCYGHSDIDLAEDALACAARLRDALPAAIPLFSSPLRRCRLLAEALHAAPVFDERLREMHFGSWEMRAWSEIPRAELDAWAAAPLAYAPPGGESVAVLRARVSAFLAERDEDFAMVAHAGVMKVLAGQVQGLVAEQWFQLRFACGELTLLEAPEASRSARAC